MTATYAGIPIDELRHLPHDTRRRLLRHLDTECTLAALRNAQILTARQTAAERDLTTQLAADADPARVIAARHHAMTLDLTHRRTA